MRILCYCLFTQKELPEYILRSIIDEDKKENTQYYKDKLEVIKEDCKTYSLYRYSLNNLNTKDSFEYFLDKFSVID